jgi:hypothetical protein
MLDNVDHRRALVSTDTGHLLDWGNPLPLMVQNVFIHVGNILP